MRKLLFFTVVLLGALVGLFATIEHKWSTRIGVMLLGAVIATPIAGLAFVGTRRSGRTHSRHRRHISSLTGDGISVEDLASNYWRDKGHPPFMNPADSVPDSKVHSPDKM